MEIINTYEETLSHYNMKISHAQDELTDALRGLNELELLASDGWQGRSGSRLLERLAELRREASAPMADIEVLCAALRQLGAAVEEDIRLMQEEAAAAAAAAAAGTAPV